MESCKVKSEKVQSCQVQSNSVMCATNGHIIDIYGLFEATRNDASIIQLVMNENSDLCNLFQEYDVILLDRGFRDAVPKLETKYKLKVRMPALLEKSQKQLTTEQANKSRFVTKCRWVVEVLNTFLKNSFKALKEVPNKSLPHTMNDYKIAGALINAFHKRLISDKENNKKIVANMKSWVNNENVLKYMYEETKLKLKSKYEKLDSSIIFDFPILDIETIKTHITLGSYQLSQAQSYIAEHLNKNGDYLIMIGREALAIDNVK